MPRGFLHIIPHQNLLDQSEDQEVTQGKVNRSKHSRTNNTIQEHVIDMWSRAEEYIYEAPVASTPHLTLLCTHITTTSINLVRGLPLWSCHDFRQFSSLFSLSPKRPLIQLRSTMTCFHIPYLILSHVPSPLSYLSSSFGHFGQKANSVISDCSG